MTRGYGAAAAKTAHFAWSHIVNMAKDKKKSDPGTLFAEDKTMRIFGT